MAHVVVYNPKNLAELQQIQHSNFKLQQPVLVELQYSRSDILSIQRVGQQVVIQLKNGEKIVIDQFFAPDGSTPHQLVLKESDGHWQQLKFDPTSQAVEYLPTQSLQSVVAGSGLSTVSAVDPSQVDSNKEVEPDDAATTKAWYEKAWVKPALIFLGVEALYFSVLKSDDDKGSDTPQDRTPPNVPVGRIDETGENVTGTAEAHATVYVIDAEGKTLGETKADEAGRYVLKLNRPVTDGERVVLYAKDSAGNVSNGTAVAGNKDTIAPEPARAQFNETGDLISGKTEPKAKVYVYAEDGTTLLAGPITAGNDGSYSVRLQPALSTGETAKIIVEDAAGNRSEPSTAIVGKDTLAPESARLEVSEDGKSITGKAEALSKVLILDANGNVLHQVTAGADGKFSFQLSNPVTDAQVWTIVVEDAAGNRSPSIQLKPKLDTLAPEAAEASVDANGLIVSGKTEANATIEVRTAEGTLLGTAQANAQGEYQVQLSKALVDNNNAYVYALDAAKNRSTETLITGTKDTIAPNKPTVRSVNDDVGTETGNISNGGTTDDARPKFDGMGEAGALVTVYHNGTAVATVTVGSNGTWTYTPSQDLNVGEHRFSFTQMDKANNTSEMSAEFRFTLVQTIQASSDTESIESLLEAPDSETVDALLNAILSAENYTAKNYTAKNYTAKNEIDADSIKEPTALEARHDLQQPHLSNSYTDEWSSIQANYYI